MTDAVSRLYEAWRPAVWSFKFARDCSAALPLKGQPTGISVKVPMNCASSSLSTSASSTSSIAASVPVAHVPTRTTISTTRSSGPFSTSRSSPNSATALPMKCGENSAANSSGQSRFDVRVGIMLSQIGISPCRSPSDSFYVAIQIIGKYLLFINYLFINHLS